MKRLRTTKEHRSLVNDIIAFEQGELGEIETILLFSELIKTGTVWKLQGSYGREATSLMMNEIIDQKGNILVDLNSIFC